MKFEGLLARNVRGFWGTSYSFGLKLFDQYLLRRLSHSPLNAVVLVDHDKLADVWEQLAEGEQYLAKQAGRRYLLRGVRSPGGAFHPKTYLFARAEGATLVVGSGNLTRDGIDRGREVFTSFSSQRESDLPSLRAWTLWMSRLVELEGDELLRDRWIAMRDACPWMLGSTDGSQFVANDERSILDQLTERLPDTVAELHVTAPFFDRHARALQSLIGACDPERVVLYLGADASVHGPSLGAVLREARAAEVKRFEPRTFVHAKLIGAIGADGSGLLLSGSPNLSRAAMTLTCGRAEHGNWETGVVRRGEGERVRGVFEASGLALVEVSLGSLDELQFEDDHPTLARPLVLRSAAWQKDGCVAVRWTGPAELPEGTRLMWADSPEAVQIDAEGVTDEAVDERDPIPLVVWLADRDGAAISNRAAVDDPVALRETLVGSDRKRDVRPSEMVGLEMVPLVRLVLWAHDKFIFDPDDTAASRRAHDAAGEDPDAEDASGFWERYYAEELDYDPRSQTYRPLTPGGSAAAGPVDELLRELQTLLSAAPGSPHPLLRVLTAGSGDEDEEERETRAGMPWTMEARQRVRAFNLLMRWSNAVADPRHALLSPEAPVINYQTLLAVNLMAWLHEALDFKHVRRLLFTLLDAFIGSADEQGFLGRITAEERAAALRRLDPFMADVGSGLVAAAMQSGWRHDIYEWQPVLRRGFELGVLAPDRWSAEVVERLTGEAASPGEIRTLLERRIRWIDDETWCEQLASELEVQRISLDLRRGGPVRTGIRVQGVSDPLGDVRLLTVARRALDFKGVPAIAVECRESGGLGDVIVFEPGERARARVGGSTFRSSEPVTVDRVREVEDQGGSWADVLGARRAADAA